MLEFGIPIVALALLLVALSRIRREMYASGMLFIVCGLVLMLHTGVGASQSAANGSAFGWISPALCLTSPGRHC